MRSRLNCLLMPRPATWCLLAILVAGLLPRIANVALPGMYFDECCSWKISQFPWDQMIDAVSRDAHPPVFYVLLKSLGWALGDTPIIIRGVSIVFGMATILAAFHLVREALSEPSRDGTATAAPEDRDFAALLAAMLVASSALQIELSLQGRPYTLGTLIALLAASLLLRSTRTGGRWYHWAGFATSVSVLSFTHYYGLFTVGMMFLYGFSVFLQECLRGGASVRARELAVGLGLSLWGLVTAWSLWLPVFLYQRGRTTSQLWMPPLDWHGLGNTLWMAIAGGKATPFAPGWEWLALTVWGVGAGMPLLVARRSGWLVGLSAGGPLLAAVGYGLLERNILGVKYLAFAQVFLLVGCALLVSRVTWKPARGVLAAGLILWNGFWCWRFVEAREWQAAHPGICGAVEYLEQCRRPEEPVIVSSPFVFVVVQKYASHPAGIYVNYTGDHRQDILGGPPLLESEYRDVTSLFAGTSERVWAVDVFELFGPDSRFVARLPEGWVRVGQEQFREVYGLPCLLAVREYRRQSSRGTEITAQTIRDTNAGGGIANVHISN